MDELRARLSERDDAMSRLRQQSTDTVSQLEKTHMAELLAIKDHRDDLQLHVNQARSAGTSLMQSSENLYNAYS